jgi:hypothetical protein
VTYPLLLPTDDSIYSACDVIISNFMGSVSQ